MASHQAYRLGFLTPQESREQQEGTPTSVQSFLIWSRTAHLVGSCDLDSENSQQCSISFRKQHGKGRKVRKGVFHSQTNKHDMLPHRPRSLHSLILTILLRCHFGGILMTIYTEFRGRPSGWCHPSSLLPRPTWARFLSYVLSCIQAIRESHFLCSQNLSQRPPFLSASAVAHKPRAPLSYPECHCRTLPITHSHPASPQPLPTRKPQLPPRNEENTVALLRSETSGSSSHLQ